MTREENIKAIIDDLKPFYHMEFIFGLLGNIKVETANTFDPRTVQKGKGFTNDSYIEAVEHGPHNFVEDGIGFGLFQLTSWGRKQRFQLFCMGNGKSIGDLKNQLAYFRYEVNQTGYANVRMAIRDQWSIEDCAEIICKEYERPASMQKDEVTKQRAIQNRIDTALLLYNEFKDYYNGKERARVTLKICLDAGHYGKYNRSPVVPSYYESDFTWNFTNYEADELTRLGFEVIKTRANKDKDLSLDKRGKMSKGCVLFISNHSNACGTESVDHPSIIIPRPNGEALITDCTVLANRIGDNIHKTIGTKQVAKVYDKDAGYDRNGNKVKYDDEYYGVMNGAQSTDCPMYMIVEHGFHTNKKCATWLLDDNNVRKLAISEAHIIADFLKEKYDLPQTGDEHPDEKHDFDEPTDTYTYTVVKGDTLSKIAKQFDCTVDEIVALNPIITNKNCLTVGWKLLIPMVGETKYYIVKKGDTLSAIAKRFNVKGGYVALAKYNNIAWPYNKLAIGQTLLIPQ